MKLPFAFTVTVAIFLSSFASARAADVQRLFVAIGNVSNLNVATAFVSAGGELVSTKPLGSGIASIGDEIGLADKQTVGEGSSVTVFSREVVEDLGVSAGAFVSFPEEGAGREFRLASPAENYVASRFVVYAPENATITIRPSKDWSEERLNGVDYTVQLLAGHYYTATSPDLAGTLVTSTKPVFVVAGSNCAWVGAGELCDQAVSPIPAIEDWGTKHVIAPNSGKNTQHLVRIIAHYENTQVRFNGGVLTDIIPGSTWEGTLDSLAVIDSTHPVMVVQFAEDQIGELGGGSDMVVVPPVHQWKSNYEFYAPISFFSLNQLILVAPSDSVVQLADVNESQWNLSGSYKYKIVESLAEVQAVSSSMPLMVLAEGIDVDSSYLFSAGQNFVNLPSSPEVTPSPSVTASADPTTSPAPATSSEPPAAQTSAPPTPEPSTSASVEPTPTQSTAATPEPSATQEVVVPTPTSTPTPTVTPTPEVTSTATPTPVATVTPTPQATASPEPTASTSPSPIVATPTASPTAMVTPSPSVSASVQEPPTTSAPPPVAVAAPPVFSGGGGGSSPVAAAPVVVTAQQVEVKEVAVVEVIKEAAVKVVAPSLAVKQIVPMSVGFAAASTKLSSSQIRAITLKAKSLKPGTVVTCIGYSGPGTNPAALRTLAMSRASNVCDAYAKAAKVKTKTSFGGVLKGSAASNRKVIVRFG